MSGAGAAGGSFAEEATRLHATLERVAGRAGAAADRARAPLGGSLATHGFALSEHERIALLLAVAAEWVPAIASAVRALGGAPWPTVSLALAVAAAEGVRGSPRDVLAGIAVRDGLLELVGDGPLVARTLRCAPDCVAVIAGEADAASEREASDAEAFAALIAAPDDKRRLAQWAHAPDARPLLLVGAAGSGRRRWAIAAAQLAARPLVIIDGDADVRGAALALRRRGRWHGAVAMLRLGAGPDAPARLRACWRALARIEAPLVVAVEPADCDDAITAAPRAPVAIEVGPLDPASRARLWTRLMPDLGGRAELDELAAVYDLGTRDVSRAVSLARADAAEDPVRAVANACRQRGAGALAPYADRIAIRYARADLVVPTAVGDELDLAIAWAGQRATVLDAWGLGALGGAAGLAVLFAGKPGTGKTMAAQILAGALGRELYRVDLSRLVSKYIGETEKHLSSVFAAAAGAGGVLFFDEADALFGRRGQVREARDRYANLEVGYLLQRVEQHAGIIVLATNRPGDLDDAFLRRFHAAITFPMPDVPERLRLWRRMLPVTLPQAPELPIERFARDYAIAGGDIQQAVLGAAMLAAEDGGVLEERHLSRGLHRVLRKNGAVADEQLLHGARGLSGPGR